ncbi:hypothetical protein [Roseiflexus castenholzii]|uniref:Transmembrane protein n=1 Tax=Roseiflexus castenholzii (strain DSM 13941 / HLO8) TaxID=383372 RepID=A7NID7_ROSCS|nr:hypothetical protein [Roseiflexus castenholzii]ABU57237.1 conserved hypothetical protein [Roseiflexus castenholzii DSM 13941]
MVAQHRQSFPWGAVIWSSILMVVIPLGFAFAVSVGYGVVVGFQTRGDPEAIHAAVTALASAAWYRALPKVLLAIVAFWRGTRLARLAAPAAPSVVGAVLLALVLLVVLAVALFSAPLNGEQALSFAVDAVVMLACGLVGARAARR